MSATRTVNTVCQPDRTDALKANAVKSKRFRRRKKIIKPKYQLKLACFVVVFLLIYSLVFGTAIFLPLAMELHESVTVEEGGRAALVVLRLHEAIWPALGFVLVLSFLGTILFSHRFVGPIYRLERAAEDFVKGKFKRIRLRKNDEFKEIEISVNKMADYLNSVQTSGSRLHSDMLENLYQLSEMVRDNKYSREDAIQLMDEIIVELATKPNAFTLTKE
jgi:HAMP domain-containing protein